MKVEPYELVYEERKLNKKKVFGAVLILLLIIGLSIYSGVKSAEYAHEKEQADKNQKEQEIAEQITELIDPDVFQFDYCTFRDYHLYKHFNNSKCPFIKEINSLDEVTDSISKINIFLNEGKNVKMIKERIISIIAQI